MNLYQDLKLAVNRWSPSNLTKHNVIKKKNEQQHFCLHICKAVPPNTCSCKESKRLFSKVFAQWKLMLIQVRLSPKTKCNPLKNLPLPCEKVDLLLIIKTFGVKCEVVFNTTIINQSIMFAFYGCKNLKYFIAVGIFFPFASNKLSGFY